jgi:hypothetical protein
MLNKNGRFRDLFSLQHQGRRGEWPRVVDFYTSLSNRCTFLFVFSAVKGRSQTVRSPIRLQPLTVLLNLVSLLSNCFVFFSADSSLCLLGVFVMYVCWSALISWCWDPMLYSAWTLPLCLGLHCQDVILCLLLLWQVGSSSPMFWLVLRSHGTWSGGLIQCCGCTENTRLSNTVNG